MGLVGVPIQVWSTKSFSATWRANGIGPANRCSARTCNAPRRSRGISGTITSGLPVTLDDVVIYAGSGADAKWYSIGRLVPDFPSTVANIHAAGTQAMSMDEWLKTGPARPSSQEQSRLSRGHRTDHGHQEIAFFTQSDHIGRRDSPLLRYLDQSWRIRHRDEVILVGRVARTSGPLKS